MKYCDYIDIQMYGKYFRFFFVIRFRAVKVRKSSYFYVLKFLYNIQFYFVIYNSEEFRLNFCQKIYIIIPRYVNNYRLKVF